MSKDLGEGDPFDRDQTQRQLLDALWGILEAVKVFTRKWPYSYPQSLAWRSQQVGCCNLSLQRQQSLGVRRAHRRM